MFKIIGSFLSGRTQRVTIKRILSSSVELLSGVQQGSVLGPLLFLIYINDLYDIFSDNVTSKYFADDAKLYTEVETGEDIDDLQFSLDLLAEWALTWQLGVSFLKCSTIDIGRKKDCGAYCENSIEGQILVNKSEVTDLGIIFDSCLTFTTRINQIVSKAKQRIFLLYRAFRTRDTRLLLKAYKSYILPLLDYCSPVWSPARLCNIADLESVHRFSPVNFLGSNLSRTQRDYAF